jgi:septal ring factor EnvC (AmiA/AmiB activator)
MARVRLDSYKSQLRSLEGELGRKDLEKEALVSSLKDANAKIKRLRLELKRKKKGNSGPCGLL